METNGQENKKQNHCALHLTHLSMKAEAGWENGAKKRGKTRGKT